MNTLYYNAGSSASGGPSASEWAATTPSAKSRGRTTKAKRGRATNNKGGKGRPSSSKGSGKDTGKQKVNNKQNNEATVSSQKAKEEEPAKEAVQPPPFKREDFQLLEQELQRAYHKTGSIKSEPAVLTEDDLNFLQRVPKPPPPHPDPETTPLTIPACSSWFRMDDIHDIEKRYNIEFFSGQSSFKTPETYKKYRNFIIDLYRQNPNVYLTATAVRRYLAGDAAAILRVHSFLERWGLINFNVSEESVPQRLGPKSTADTPVYTSGSNKQSNGTGHMPDSRSANVYGGRSHDRSYEGDYIGRVNDQSSSHVDAVRQFLEDMKLPTNGQVYGGDGEEWDGEELERLFEAVHRELTGSISGGDNDLEQGKQVPNVDWQRVANAVGTKSPDDCLLKFVTTNLGQEVSGTGNDASPSSFSWSSAIQRAAACFPQHVLRDAYNAAKTQLDSTVGSLMLTSANENTRPSHCENNEGIRDMVNEASTNCAMTATSMLIQAIVEDRKKLQREREYSQQLEKELLRVSASEQLPCLYTYSHRHMHCLQMNARMEKVTELESLYEDKLAHLEQMKGSHSSGKSVGFLIYFYLPSDIAMHCFVLYLYLQVETHDNDTTMENNEANGNR